MCALRVKVLDHKHAHHLNSLCPPTAKGAQQQLWRRAYAIGTDTTGDETHDDFKPKYKAAPVDDVEAQIKKDVASHDAFIYMKVCVCVHGTCARAARACGERGGGGGVDAHAALPPSLSHAHPPCAQHTHTHTLKTGRARRADVRL